MRILGDVPDYPALTEIMRQRAAYLQLTYEVIDEVAGVPKGYTGKVLSPMPSKRIGAQSMTLFLPALGMKLIAVEDLAALEYIRRRRHRRQATAAMHSGVVHFVITRRELRQRGRKGGANSRLKMSKAKARALAKKAARARWNAAGRPRPAPATTPAPCADQSPPA